MSSEVAGIILFFLYSVIFIVGIYVGFQLGTWFLERGEKKK